MLTKVKKGKGAKKAAAKPAVKAPEAKLVDHIVTAEDLAGNPGLTEQGVKEGDTIQIPEDVIITDVPEAVIPPTSEEEDEEENGDNDDEEDDEDESASKEVSVLKENGEFVRSYSLSDHGKDYKKLAKEYAGKIGGSIK